MQIAYWKTRDSKYWLRLYEVPGPMSHMVYYESNSGGNTLDDVLVENALQHVQEEVIAHWPSKGIRQH